MISVLYLDRNQELVPKDNMQGKWGGYNVTFMDGNRSMKLEVAEGVRGLNIPVAVHKSDNGSYQVYSNGEAIEVKSVWESTWVKVK